MELTYVNVLGVRRDAAAADEPRHPIPEEAMRLAAKLHASLREGSRVLQLTGVGAGDGVTRVATLVASAFTRLAPQSVVLIDANVRTPGLHTAFDVPAAPGLVDVILDRTPLDTAVQATTVPGLFLLPAGVAGADASLFTSPSWTDLLREARRRFGYVVIDSAPVLHYADSALIAQMVDGVVVVMSSGRRRRTDLVQIKRLLDGVKAHLIGVVLSEPDQAINP